ncbi:phosphatidate cytidylyltransferase [Planktotalea sp.]|uniref:phosphatidate cytidylyltransferase n=1 Tax=Planktotalea sp. TaxID=2029877 RepID=UPI003D6BC809
MSVSSGKWGDLGPRVLSGVAMAVIGIAAVWLGGFWMHLLVSLACGLMVWELARMLNPSETQTPIWIGLVGGGALFAASFAPYATLILPFLIAPSLVGQSMLKGEELPRNGKAIFVAYSIGILVAGYSLISLRDLFGASWFVWLILVVIATDVAGYFAGRTFGGPKFWPRVSPKKTWSGTVAGWFAAAIIGVFFMFYMNSGGLVVAISVALALASQMGDIAESAIKRHVGIKDSSNLIPGHGGLLDRFDGVLGAALLLIVIGAFVAFPPSVIG